MSDLAIRVDNLSKLYHIGKAQRRHDTLRDAITGAFKRLDVPTLMDTPVKHYSSGMYVRLAFAVAAHLEPEILLVDESLS